MHQAYISVGSNLGRKVENCRRGIHELTTAGRSILVAASPFYRTSPVDYLDQDWFVNAVIKIETERDPFALLHDLRCIEKKVGRKANTIRFGPRVLDLDIIFFDDAVIQSDTLEIPHPRMHKRRFVLKPICDIDPSMLHPVLGEDMQSLLNSLQDEDQEVLRIE